jgi:GT2 family glycosyltransferase
MSVKPQTAIVILNWNGIALLTKYLPTVIKHSEIEGVTVYVADNGSSDDSVEYIRSSHPDVRIIENETNYGFAKGYNLALRQIDAKYFVLLNSDVEVTENWLEPCIRRMEADSRLAALQPKVLSWSHREHFEYAGAAGGYLDWLGYPFCRGRILYHTETDNGQYNQSLSLLWATGACLFIRAEVFINSGGFDDDFFAHMEEIDLCWRLKNQGWKIGIETESRVYHQGGATLSYHSPAKVYLNFRNSLWMMVKNLPQGKVVHIIIFRLILDGVAAVRFLFTGKLSAFQAVFSAHLSFYGKLRRFIAKRRVLLPNVTNTNHPEIYKSSMVMKFYLLRKKKFSELGFHPPIL